MKRWLKMAAGAAAITLATAGCAGSGSGDSTNSSAAASNGSLTVWLMTGTAPEALTNSLHKEFEDAHPGVKVKYEI